MPLSSKVLAAKINLRIAELRLLGAWTAVAVFNRHNPPPLPCLFAEASPVGALSARPSPAPNNPPAATPSPSGSGRTGQEGHANESF
jgi:hypothetical protein